MPSNIIQWFPGHMAKTRRLMSESMGLVDLVIEIRDARIPISSKNPEIERLCAGKPRIILLSKADLASPDINASWKKHFESEGTTAVVCDFVSGKGVSEIPVAIRMVMAEKITRYEAKGMVGKQIRAMIVGIPNVGKSSFINKLAGSKKAKVEDRPGVTLNKQWVKTSMGFELLDMPGVLWPKFEDATVGENLSMTGAIKDDVVYTEDVACKLCGRIKDCSPRSLCERYKLGDPDAIRELEDYEIFELIGRKRGFLISGGEVNYERTATMLLDEFRAGKIGRISLEKPSDLLKAAETEENEEIQE